MSVLPWRRKRRSRAPREKLRAIFWIPFDADVLDDAIMPAVDYRLPGGLTWVEIEEVLSAALALRTWLAWRLQY